MNKQAMLVSIDVVHGARVYAAAKEEGSDHLSALATTRSIMSYEDEGKVVDALDWGLSMLGLEIWLGLSELFEMDAAVVTRHLGRFGVRFSDSAMELLLSDVELFDEIVYGALVFEAEEDDDLYDILVSIAYEIDSANQEEYYCIYCGEPAGVNFVCDDCQDEIMEELAMLHPVYRCCSI